MDKDYTKNKVDNLSHWFKVAVTQLQHKELLAAEDKHFVKMLLKDGKSYGEDEEDVSDKYSDIESESPCKKQKKELEQKLQKVQEDMVKREMVKRAPSERNTKKHKQRVYGYKLCSWNKCNCREFLQ